MSNETPEFDVDPDSFSPEMSSSISSNTSSRHQAIIRLFEDAPEIGRHTVALILSVVSIWMIHITLDYLLGKDVKFFDVIPIRYITDAAHLIVFLKFIWHIVTGLRR